MQKSFTKNRQEQVRMNLFIILDIRRNNKNSEINTNNSNGLLVNNSYLSSVKSKYQDRTQSIEKELIGEDGK